MRGALLGLARALCGFFPLCGFMLLLWLLFGPTAALAFPLKVSEKQQLRIDVALTSLLQYYTNNLNFQRPAHSKQFVDLRNKLDVTIAGSDIRVGTRLDTYHFFLDRAPCPADFSNCKSMVIPEKIYLKIVKKNITITGGDFYLTLGRGLLISIRKVDEFAIDNTIRGGRITYDDGVTSATVAAGFINSNNFDPIQATFLYDTNDRVIATQIARRFHPKVNIGGQYAYYHAAPWIQESEESGNPPGLLLASYSHIAGGFMQFDRINDKVDFYIEANTQLRQLGKQDDVGYAVYANLNGYAFPFTWRFEFQWYRKYAVLAQTPSLYKPRLSTDPPDVEIAPNNYLNPPSMERLDLDTLGDASNTRGFRLRLDYTFPDRKKIVYANYMLRAGYEESPGAPLLYIHHFYAGFEYRDEPFDVIGSLGWRQTINNPDWRVLHANVDGTYTFRHKHSLEMSLYYLGHEKDERKYNIFDFQFGYTFSKRIAAAFLYSYSDEEETEGVSRNFVAGQVKLMFGQYGSVRVAYGSMRGGLRCISGVCRVFPPFEGFLTELNLRF